MINRAFRFNFHFFAIEFFYRPIMRQSAFNWVGRPQFISNGFCFSFRYKKRYFAMGIIKNTKKDD